MSEAKKGKETKPATKKGGGFKFILLMIIVGALVPFGAPTLLVCMGMIPTLVALVTDTDPRKSGAATVGFLNAAGVVPFIIELWQKDQTMPAAISIVREPSTWVVMLGGAALGHLILYAVPAAIALLTVTKMEMRLKTLREGIEQLHAIWGAEVSSARSLEDLRRRDES